MITRLLRLGNLCLIASSSFIVFFSAGIEVSFAEDAKPETLFKIVGAPNPSVRSKGAYVQFKDAVQKLNSASQLIFKLKGKTYRLNNISQDLVERQDGTLRNVINAELIEHSSGKPMGEASFGVSKSRRKLLTVSIMLKEAGSYTLSKIRRSRLFKLSAAAKLKFTKEPIDLEVQESNKNALTEIKINCAYNTSSRDKNRRLVLISRSYSEGTWSKWVNNNKETVSSVERIFSTGGYAGEIKQYICRVLDYRSGVTLSQSNVGTVFYLLSGASPSGIPNQNATPKVSATPYPNVTPTNTPTPLSQSEKFQNRLNPLDVNGDTVISGIDSLLIINYNRKYGDPAPLPSGTPPPYLDVNGDKQITSEDTKEIFNYLNNKPMPAIILDSVLIDGANLEVTYSKNFDGCVSMYTIGNQLAHDGEVFCGMGEHIKDTQQLSKFRNISLGIQVYLKTANEVVQSSAVMVLTTAGEITCLTRCSLPATKYKVTVLGPSTDAATEVGSGMGINDRGFTTGPFWPESVNIGAIRTSSFTTSVGHYYFYTEDLHPSVEASALPLAGEYPLAIDINNYYQIVGRYAAGRPNENYAGFIFDIKTGIEVTLPKLRARGAGIDMFVKAINDFGQVVGYNIAENTGMPCGERAEEAFVYDNAVLRSIDPGSQNSRAYGNNNLGLVVGQAETACKSGVHKPFVYSQQDGLRYLKTHDNGPFWRSGAYSITDKGLIVGEQGGKAYQWCGVDAEPQSLGELKSNAGGSAFSVNAKGLAVGQAVDASGQMVATVYSYCPSQGIFGNAQRLDSLLLSDSDPWKLSAAFSINDSGEIIAVGLNMARSWDPNNRAYAIKLTPQ